MAQRWNFWAQELALDAVVWWGYAKRQEFNLLMIASSFVLHVDAKQLDMAWNSKTVSVWDLGQVEEEAHEQGKLAVWEEEAQQQLARQEEASRVKGLEGDGLLS